MNRETGQSGYWAQKVKELPEKELVRASYFEHMIVSKQCKGMACCVCSCMPLKLIPRQIPGFMSAIYKDRGSCVRPERRLLLNPCCALRPRWLVFGALPKVSYPSRRTDFSSQQTYFGIRRFQFNGDYTHDSAQRTRELQKTGLGEITS